MIAQVLIGLPLLALAAVIGMLLRWLDKRRAAKAAREEATEAPLV